MPDREKVIERLTGLKELLKFQKDILGYGSFIEDINDVLALLKEQEARIKKYEYVFDFLGIGFREWATKILHGEAEAICEADEHEHKTVITFKLI